MRSMSFSARGGIDAYLRVAQAYMLISMLTGTSTILGLFQAMSFLLRCSGGTIACLRKKLRSERDFALYGSDRHCLLLEIVHRRPIEERWRRLD